jgi:hypothetical protein
MRVHAVFRHQIANAVPKIAISAGVLVLSILLGYKASLYWLVLLVAGMGLLLLLQQPILRLVILIFAAISIPLTFSTGTAVVLNPVTLLIAAVFVLWLLDCMRRRAWHLAPSRTNRPLLLFVASGLLSLLIGNATWDPAVPHPSSFVIVQTAQWSIFAFSAIAYWLMANMVRDETWLWRLTVFFLVVAGVLGILFVIPRAGVLFSRITTGVFGRPPFWMLLVAIAGGQLLFNRELSTSWHLLLVASIGAGAVYALYWSRESTSTWVGMAAALGVLAWLRWPRLRWSVMILLVILASTGVLSSAIYGLAGGDEEWERSGGSRLALIRRVLEVTMRNPLTGLGPAAYRNYARMKPLAYGRALWMEPGVSSHNNYVDLFSHVGILGLGLFLWFAAEVARLGLRLRAHFTQGFAAGYVNAMLATGTSAMILMLFADWILPYVYNIGFPGFQASVLVWLFLGGLVALEQVKDSE